MSATRLRRAIADLHLHTTCSDGRLSPGDLVRLCAGRGLRVIAITDHDTTAGVAEAIQAANAFPGMEVIPGVELSADLLGVEVHVLGYYVDPDHGDLRHTLEGFRRDREERARRMVDRLRELGVDVAWGRVAELASGGAIGRPHIARAMVEAGHVAYPREAFNRYLGRDGPAYVARPSPTPVDAVRILARAGALPVLAHPAHSAAKGARPGVGGLRTIVSRMKEAGLVGMEVFYGDYSAEQVRALSDLANELNLVPCGGSDYHAVGDPGEVEPGRVGPPEESVAALRSLRPRRAVG